MLTLFLLLLSLVATDITPVRYEDDSMTITLCLRGGLCEVDGYAYQVFIPLAIEGN